MNPTERIVASIEGRETDRVPTFSYYLDSYPVEQVLGKSLLARSFMLQNPVAGIFLNALGKRVGGLMLYPVIDHLMMKSIEASVKLGFDSVVGLFERMFMIWDAKTMARVTGSFYDILDDGHGNSYYMYRGPAIDSPEAFDAWPYFPDIDDLSHQTYKFFKKAQSKFGDEICLLGQSSFGIHESILWSVGFERMALFIRREPKMIKRFIKLLEEIVMRTNMAMMDAGIKVIFDGDDFAFKTGPMMNPKLCDDLFGASYRRITKAVHDRGGKVLLHSCGDNTKMFDYFIQWGFDGGHAYENTSNVDIFREKEIHGDVFTIVGGVGVDYLLTTRSKPEEVEEKVAELIKRCGPGGRFLIGPIHDHPDMDMEKVRVMIEAAHKYGKYPIDKTGQ